MPSTFKRCRDCGETKAVRDFYARPKMRDGYRSSCKVCRNIQIDTHRHLMMENKEWRDRKRAHSRQAAAKAWANGRRTTLNRVAIRAQDRVKYAVKTGRLLPPDNCEGCGHDFSDFRREAHHDDYAHPLVVRWLCSRCHGRHHSKKALEAQPA